MEKLAVRRRTMPAAGARMRRMGRTREDMLEAEMARLNDVLLKLEAERAAAWERGEQIAAEPFDTPEQEAEISRRMEINDQEAARIGEKIAEAEDDWRRATGDWLSGADDDDDDADGDTEEAISVWDAADIWMSSGMDEDYMSGYTEDELRRAAEEK
jgi:hypothetical protein